MLIDRWLPQIHFPDFSFKFIGNSVIRPLFLPLAGDPPKRLVEKIKENRNKVEQFWKREVDQLYSITDVRQIFFRREEFFSVEINGKSLKIKVGIIETQATGNYQQIAFGLPNLSTVSSCHEGIHPLLSAYVEKHKESSLQPARFFLISAYDMTCEGDQYDVESLDDSGLIFKMTLDEITTKYGNVDTVLVHSVSCFRLAAAVNHRFSAKRVIVDRGPSSVEALSKIYFLGQIGLMPIARACGWNLNVGNKLLEYLSNSDSEVVIAGVADDHRFPGDANLCNHPSIRHVLGLKIQENRGSSYFKVLSVVLTLFGIYANRPMVTAVGTYFLVQKIENPQLVVQSAKVFKCTLLHFETATFQKGTTSHAAPIDQLEQKSLIENVGPLQFLEGQNLAQAVIDWVFS